jgi:CBS-domain-containing membrane protein
VIEAAAHELPARLPRSEGAKQPAILGDDTLADVTKSLAGLLVRDVMARHVVEAKRDQMMTDIAVEMVRHDLSAVPVVDDEGRCVGMLAASDFMKELAPEERFDEIAQRQNAQALLDEFSERALTAEELSGDRVFMHMSENVRGIDPEATIADAAKLMCAAHVHRLPVLDPNHRVLGIVSSLDLVAALSVALATAASGDAFSFPSPS